MDPAQWVYFLPAGVFFIASIFLAADVDVSHAENSSTLKLRLMILCFGLANIFFGAGIWYLGIESWRLPPELRWTTKYLFLFIGVVLVLTAALRSRGSLIKYSEYFTKPHYDIEIGGKPEITPAERVNRYAANAETKPRNQG